MRARSAKQRFPVAQWKEDLGILQETAIKLHRKKLYDELELKDAKRNPKQPKRMPKRTAPKVARSSLLRNSLPQEDDSESYSRSSRTPLIASAAADREPQLMDWQLDTDEQDEGYLAADDNYSGTVTADESYAGTAQHTDAMPSEDEEESGDTRGMPFDVR